MIYGYDLDDIDNGRPKALKEKITQKKKKKRKEKKRKGNDTPAGKETKIGNETTRCDSDVMIL